MARKRSSKIKIENYVNGSPITPGVTYKLGDADANTAWLLASSSPCLFKLSATAPTDELWSNIKPEQFIINGAVSGQVIEIESPNGKYFVVPTNAQDKNASVDSAHATIALHPLGFNYDQEYQALPLDGDGPVSEGFYKISNLESGKLYSINVHPDLGGLMETKPNPEFSYALFSVGADNNPKAFLAGGKTTDQLVFVATETSAILSLGSTIEEAGYFVSIRNFSLGSGEGGGSGTGFDPASDQTISGAWSFTNTAGLVLGNEVPLVLGQGVDAVKIHGDGSGAAVIEGTDASHMDVAIPVKFQNPTTFDDSISFVATTGEKMKCILFGKESGPTRAILYEESNGFLSITDPNNVNNKTLTIDGAGDLWVYKNENHNGVVTFNSQTRMHGTIDVGGVMTFRKTPNANAGINIPLTVVMSSDTSAVNRATAFGAGVINDIMTQEGLITQMVETGATVEEVLPKQFYSMKNSSQGPCTVRMVVGGYIGTNSNYGDVMGIFIPYGPSGSADTKITFPIGVQPSGGYATNVGQPLDKFTLAPKEGTSTSVGRIIDVTFKKTKDVGLDGFPVIVREVFYNVTEAKWQVHTTTSFIPSFNTALRCVSGIVYQQDRAGRQGSACLWATLAAGHNVACAIKLADLLGVPDNFNWTYTSQYYWDAEATESVVSCPIRSPRVYFLNSPTGYNANYYAIKAIETDNTQGPATVTDFIFDTTQA